MARPVLGEAIFIASERGRIGSGILSGPILVNNPDAEKIQFALKFADADILNPKLYATWALQEKKSGSAVFQDWKAISDLRQYRGSAIGAVDNETSPSLLTVDNPLQTGKRRFANSELRLEFSLSGRLGGVDVDISAYLLGADDGVPEE